VAAAGPSELAALHLSDMLNPSGIKYCMQLFWCWYTSRRHCSPEGGRRQGGEQEEEAQVLHSWWAGEVRWGGFKAYEGAGWTGKRTDPLTRKWEGGSRGKQEKPLGAGRRKGGRRGCSGCEWSGRRATALI